MSRNLHNTDYIFQPKRGLAANLNSTANKNSAVDGELAYTTDRKQLNIFNGTEFEEVNKYTQYFFNSSGSQSGNRFNNFADMIDSIGGREVRVQFEQDETLPTGTYNLSYQIWVGNGNNPDSGAPQITFPDGFVCGDNAINWYAENGLTLRSESSSPIVTASIPTTHFFDRCDVEATTAPFFDIQSNGLHAFGVSNGGAFRDAGVPVVTETAADPYSAIVVITEQGISPEVENDTFSSTNEIIFLHLKQSATVSSPYSTHSGINGSSVLQYQAFANAKVIGFLEGNPTGITSDNVSDALAELYAGKAELVATPSSASDTGTAGQVSCDSSYFYWCYATDSWRRVAYDSW